MTMGETIRKKRGEKNLSQKDMAEYLGVTSSAVSKWEKGKALPDVTLLGPLARLLEVSLEELLDFQKELTTDQITDYLEEAHRKLKTEPFSVVAAWAENLILTFPRSYQLILWLTSLLESQGVMGKELMTKPLEELFEKWYQRVLLSGDEQERLSAAERLFYFYLRKEKLDQAEEALQYYSLENPGRKKKKALLAAKKGDLEEAWKAYEELLFSSFQTASETFQEMASLAMEEKKMDTVKLLVEKQGLLAKSFDMGQYYEVSPGFELAMLSNDPETTRKILGDMLQGIEEMDHFTRSPLYAHMTFKELSSDFKEEVRKDLLDALKDGETFSDID